MLKKSKKGAVEVQINWIFVLVVGGIILIFFVGLVMKQKTVSQTKYSVAVRENLDAIFTSSEVATGTSSLVSVPEIRVDFDCNNYYVGDFGTGISKTLGPSRVIFAPSSIQGRQLVTWSLEWNMPYKIVDFLYITSTQMRYIFVYENDNQQLENAAKEVFKILPEEMNKEIYGYDASSDEYIDPDTGSSAPDLIKYQNNYKTRFIFFFNIPETGIVRLNIDASFNGKDVSVLHIPPSALENTQLNFYRYDQDFISPVYRVMSEGPAILSIDYNPEFITEKKYPTLFGAIFTDNQEMYDCMMKKAMRRHTFISEIYLQRLDAIFASRSQLLKSRGCNSGLYGDGYDVLGQLKANAVTCIASIEPSQCNFASIPSLVESNKKVQLESCPLIY